MARGASVNVELSAASRTRRGNEVWGDETFKRDEIQSLCAGSLLRSAIEDLSQISSSWDSTSC